jgi:hypothetical protein
MPFYKTTTNIFVDFDEHFNPNWMDGDEIYVPPNVKWDYQREMTIDDVDLWEVIWEDTWSVYAAYQPYAEFYLLKYPLDYVEKRPDLPPFETFYGQGAQERLQRHLSQWKIKLPQNQLWVEDEEMWLYKK